MSEFGRLVCILDGTTFIAEHHGRLVTKSLWGIEPTDPHGKTREAFEQLLTDHAGMKSGKQLELAWDAKANDSVVLWVPSLHSNETPDLHELGEKGVAANRCLVQRGVARTLPDSGAHYWSADETQIEAAAPAAAAAAAGPPSHLARIRPSEATPIEQVKTPTSQVARLPNIRSSIKGKRTAADRVNLHLIYSL